VELLWFKVGGLWGRGVAGAEAVVAGNRVGFGVDFVRVEEGLG
jgi:hypothetical protein